MSYKHLKNNLQSYTFAIFQNTNKIKYVLKFHGLEKALIFFQWIEKQKEIISNFAAWKFEPFCQRPNKKFINN